MCLFKNKLHEGKRLSIVSASCKFKFDFHKTKKNVSLNPLLLACRLDRLYVGHACVIWFVWVKIVILHWVVTLAAEVDASESNSEPKPSFCFWNGAHPRPFFEVSVELHLEQNRQNMHSIGSEKGLMTKTSGLVGHFTAPTRISYFSSVLLNWISGVVTQQTFGQEVSNLHTYIHKPLLALRTI